MRNAPAAAVTALAALTTAVVPATAHAAVQTHLQFASPTGNIHCVLNAQDRPGPVALCQIQDKTYAVPAGMSRDENGGPCPSGSVSGNDFRLDPGQPGFIRCSYAALDAGVGPWRTLEYGESRSLGTLTCESQLVAVTCTDTDSGHFFRVSRTFYELG